MAVNKYILPKNSKRKSEKVQWESQIRYTDFTGKIVQKHKRGFNTMREAKEWEQQFLAQANCKLNDMTFKRILSLDKIMCS